MNSKRPRKFRGSPDIGWWFVAIALLFVFQVGGVSAEVLYLHNGEILIGDIVGQTATAIRIQTDQGVRTVPKAAIARTTFQPGEEVRARAVLKRREEEKKQQEEARRERAEEQRLADEAAARRQAQAHTPPARFVARSATLPGYGHISMNQPATGYTYMVLITLAVGNALYSREAAIAARARYNQNVLLYTMQGVVGEKDLESRLAFGVYTSSVEFKSYENAVDRYNASLGILAGVYLVQLFHASFDAYSGAGTDAVLRAGDGELLFAALPIAEGRDARVAAVAEWRLRF